MAVAPKNCCRLCNHLLWKDREREEEVEGSNETSPPTASDSAPCERAKGTQGPREAQPETPELCSPAASAALQLEPAAVFLESRGRTLLGFKLGRLRFCHYKSADLSSL